MITRINITITPSVILHGSSFLIFEAYMYGKNFPKEMFSYRTVNK